jgi:hypothetical protein
MNLVYDSKTYTMDIMYDVSLTSMNNIKKITGFCVVAGMFLIAALATSTVRTAFAQNTYNLLTYVRA